MSNPMNKKMFFIDETETEESTYNFAAQLPNSYGSKKSITSFPSKIFLDDSKNNIPKRKYTLEPSLCIKDFVPHPKPLEIHFVPSKLRLNTKGFKDFKINQSNQILLDSNKYYISCPESENSDSSDSDEYINLKSKNTMKDMMNKEVLLNDINEETGLNLDMSFIERLFEHQKYIADIDDDVIETLEYLKDKYDIVLLTNYFIEPQIGRLKKVGIDKYFSRFIGGDMKRN